jgi:hypothetical protein
LAWVAGMSNPSLALSQRRKVKRQWTRRWSTDSVHCLHKGQTPQFGHPRFAKRSDVQILFFHIINHLHKIKYSLRP